MQLRKIVTFDKNYNKKQNGGLQEKRSVLINPDQIRKIEIVGENPETDGHYEVYLIGEQPHDCLITNEEGIKNILKHESEAEEAAMVENFLNGHKCS